MGLNLSKELGDAAAVGDVKRVKTLLSSNADPNYQNASGHSALHRASWRGDEAVVGVLLNAKALINLQDNGGWTPLHKASEKGQSPVVKLLLTHHANPNVKNKFGQTARDVARTVGKDDVAKILDGAPSPSLAPSPSPSPPFRPNRQRRGEDMLPTFTAMKRLAAVAGTLAVGFTLTTFLLRRTVSPRTNSSSTSTITPQSTGTVVSTGSTTTISTTSAKGTLINITSPPGPLLLSGPPSTADRVTATSEAVIHELNTVKLKASEDKRQQLQFAVVERFAQDWRQNNTSPTIEDIRLLSPDFAPEAVTVFLSAGVILRRQDIVKFILQQFPKLNLDIPVQGGTPLYHACLTGDVNIVELLLASRADPHQKGEATEGRVPISPFQAAIRYGHHDLLVKLDPRADVKRVKLGDLDIVKRLGSRKNVPGYHGVCSAVYHVRLKRCPEFEMAMKVVYNYHNDINSSVSVLGRFETEYKSAMARPRHPNICTPFHVFVDSAASHKLPSWDVDSSIVNDRCPCLLMELLPESLLQSIQDQQRSGVTNRFADSSSPTRGDYFSSFSYIARQLLKGVDFLQQHQVCHRDLKPDNVLISKDGIVKISDFGCCVDFKAENLEEFKLPFPTRYVDRGGAVEYLPPEIRGAQPGPNAHLDYGKSDNFALGRIFYDMLFDDNPCDQGGVLITERMQEMAQLRPERAEELQVVTSLLHPDPMKRSTVQEALEKVDVQPPGGISLWTEHELRP